MSKKRFPYRIIKQQEKQQMLEQYENLAEEMSIAAEFVKGIEEGKLDVEYSSEKSDSQLAVALLKMRDQLQKITKEEKERNWSTEGLAEFVEILRSNTTDLNELGDKIISNVVKYVGAVQGGLFIISEDLHGHEETVLEMVACYAYERKKHLNKKIKIGEGLLGQVYLEKETTYLTELPDKYVSITSGLGNTNPNSLLLIPLKVNEEVYGVMELASFNTFAPYQIEFLEKLGENIASSLSTVKMNEKTKTLLDDSQMRTEQMKVQEEEMRQQMEEMMSIQEQLKRKEELSSKTSKKYEEILNGCEDAVVIINHRGLVEYVNRSTINLFGYERNELIGQNVSKLIQTGHSKNHDKYIQKYLETGVKKFMSAGREEIVVTKEGKNISAFISLSEAKIDNEQFFAAFIRDLTEIKEKEHYYEQILQALPMPIFMTNNEMKWTFINKAIGTSFGLTDLDVKKMLGNECCTIDVEICKTEKCAIEMLRKGNPQTDFHFEGRHFKVDSSFLYGLDGKKTGFIEVLQDETKTDQLENELNSSTNKVKELEEELAQLKEELKAVKQERAAK